MVKLSGDTRPEEAVLLHQTAGKFKRLEDRVVWVWDGQRRHRMTSGSLEWLIGLVMRFAVQWGQVPRAGRGWIHRSGRPLFRQSCKWAPPESILECRGIPTHRRRARWSSL